MRKILLFCVLLTILFSGCSSNKWNSIIDKNQISSQINENITKCINVQDFGCLDLPYHIQGTYSYALTMTYVEDTIGIECLRVNGQKTYSIHKVLFENGKEGYCFISYDSTRVIDSWFVVKLPSKLEFLTTIKRNFTSFEQVKQLDPATILFDTDEPTSYHRFYDGSTMEITYKNVNGILIVKDRYISKDPVDIVKTILPEDMSLIT